MSIKRKIIAVVLTALLVVSAIFTGCGTDSAQTEKPKVRIALCLYSLMEGIPDKLREKYPDVEFEFTLANNSIDYYAYLYRHNDLPDIITLRRFSLRDSLVLKDTLADLSTTDFAATYYHNYIQNYTYDDGTVNWIPAVAEVWSIVANKSLFDEYGIPLPTDYPSFVAACRAFEAHGIKGFATDWRYDYTALETLEGFNIAALQSRDGKKWRMAYESGAVPDDAILRGAFVHMDQVLTDVGARPGQKLMGKEPLELTFDDVRDAMDTRQVAMVRSGSVDIASFNDRCADEFVMLPYFGATPEDNWLLTYPSYQAAINSKSAVDQKLLLDIMRYMMSEECVMAQGRGSNVLSYSSEVKITNNKYIAALDDYIAANKVFIRIASNEFFAAAKKSVHGLLTGEYDAEQAYAVFSENIHQPAPEPSYDLKIKQGYSYAFDAEHGNQAVSALLNSCREVWGVDMAVTYPISFSNSVYAGDLASKDIKFLVAGNYGSNYYLELTGREVKSLVGILLNYSAKEDGRYGAMLPKTSNLLPVVSGCEIKVSRAKGEELYQLDELTIKGKPIDEEQKYTFVFSIPAHYAQFIASQVGITLTPESKKKVPGVIPTLKQYLAVDNRQLMEPTDYIKIKD